MAVALLVAAVGVVGVGPLRAASRSSDPVAQAAPAAADGGERSGEVSEPVLAAMERDLKLTRREVLARLTEERRAVAIEERVDAELGATYAGTYLSGDTGTVTVAVTDPADADVVAQAGAVPVVVDVPLRRLEKIKAALDARAAAENPAGVSVWFIDVPGNQVVVQADDRADGRAFAKAAGLRARQVAVEVDEERPQLLKDVRGGDAYYINNTARCSVGFSVDGGFVTAGHCGTAGSTTRGYDQSSQGTFQASTFPGNDYAWVKVNSSWTPRPLVKGDGTDVVVAGAQEAAVGASVCRSGSTTGWHCGTIQAKNATVWYSQGQVSGLTRTSVCAEPGDSGGSYISGNQAQGMTSGGNGDCTSGGTTYFQPVGPALEAFGLTLVTDGSSTPTPTPTPTTESPTPTPTTQSPTPTPTDTATESPTATPTATATESPTATPTATATESPTATPTATDDSPTCDDPAKVMSGTTRSGYIWALPNTRGTELAGTQHLVCVSTPGISRSMLWVQRWTSGSGWSTVARDSTAVDGTVLAFDAEPGQFRVIMYTVSGSGEFSIAVV